MTAVMDPTTGILFRCQPWVSHKFTAISQVCGRFCSVPALVHANKDSRFQLLSSADGQSLYLSMWVAVGRSQICQQQSARASASLIFIAPVSAQDDEFEDEQPAKRFLDLDLKLLKDNPTIECRSDLVDTKCERPVLCEGQGLCRL